MEQAHLAALLQWYEAVGADEAIGDAPVNRLQANRLHVSEKTPQKPAILPLGSTPKAQKADPLPVAGAIEAMKEAAAAAQSAATVADLKTAVENFDGHPLKRTATQIVFADGNAQARVMIIGDAPGTDEDRAGLPFAGASGQLLDKMIGAIGLTRAENAYITTILNWRTLGNRAPSKEEVGISLPFIHRHIELVNPAVIVLIGGAAAKILLETKETISRLRGKWLAYNGIPATVLYHPEYLMQSPSHKKIAWDDLQMIQVKLKELGVL